MEQALIMALVWFSADVQGKEIATTLTAPGDIAKDSSRSVLLTRSSTEASGPFGPVLGSVFRGECHGYSLARRLIDVATIHFTGEEKRHINISM